jgi:hypothetical protein
VKRQSESLRNYGEGSTVADIERGLLVEVISLTIK